MALSFGKSGRIHSRANRIDVRTSDIAFPAGAQVGSIEVPGASDHRSLTVHFLVRTTNSQDGTASAVATVYGYSARAASTASADGTGAWFNLGQLNNGTGITPTTGGGVANGDDVAYAETLENVGGYDRLHVLLTAVAGDFDDGGGPSGGFQVELGFEEL